MGWHAKSNSMVWEYKTVPGDVTRGENAIYFSDLHHTRDS